MRVALAQINPTVGALRANKKKIIQFIQKAREAGVECLVFPELALSGYPPQDLLLIPQFIDEMERELLEIIPETRGLSVILGCVRKNPGKGKPLHNSAAVIEGGELLGFHDKVLLPTYDVFDEARYFESGGQAQTWNLKGRRVGITICEDIWHGIEETDYARDPIQELVAQDPELLLNLSASPYYYKREENRLKVVQRAAQTLKCPVALCNQVGGNDSLIFDGHSLYVDAAGVLRARGKGFEEDLVMAEQAKSIIESDPQGELFDALVLGLRDYFCKQGFSQACLGLSGGIDSALVAVLAVHALGKEHVRALSLPTRYTSQASREDALLLSQKLDIPLEEFPIDPLFEAFLGALRGPFMGKKEDVTEENLQSRIRGVVLMAFANKFGYLLLSTSNKSESAMGYTTLYGDLCGGLAPLSDLTKHQIYALAHWVNREREVIPLRIIEKPPSAELRPNQKDSDSMPEYPIIDAVLREYIEEGLSPEQIAQKEHLSKELIEELIARIYKYEYKRRQAPPGLRVTKKAFTMGYNFPIVQGWRGKKDE